MGVFLVAATEKSMNQTKPAIASETMWGAVIVGISAVGKIAGVDVPLVDDPGLALDIATLFGAGLALHGRVRAKVPISGIFRAK